MTENVLGYDLSMASVLQHWLEANACDLSSVTFTIAAADMEGNGPINWTATIDRVDWKSAFGFSLGGALFERPDPNKFCVIRAGFDQWSFPIGRTQTLGGVQVTVMPDFGGSGTTSGPGVPAYAADLFGCEEVVTVGASQYTVGIFLVRSAAPWEFSWLGFVVRTSDNLLLESASIDEGRLTPSTLETLAGGTETSTGPYPTDFTVAVTY